jgi:hypothetical protein
MALKFGLLDLFLVFGQLVHLVVLLDQFSLD